MSRLADPSDARPLYAQVRETLVERIKAGTWKPGQLIPNEFEIAAEFGVSQGTARKALDVLAVDGLVVRRQGKGTYVVEHTPAEMLFRFFQLHDRDGRQIQPDSPFAKANAAIANKAECAALGLARGARVIRIERLRHRGKTPFVAETIVLPDALFPGLAGRSDVPNTLYDLFQKRFGLIVTRADERITAVLAGAAEAQALGVREGTPLLRIERSAFGLDDARLEWRVSLCHLADGHYFARL